MTFQTFDCPLIKPYFSNSGILKVIANLHLKALCLNKQLFGTVYQSSHLDWNSSSSWKNTTPQHNAATAMFTCGYDVLIVIQSPVHEPNTFVIKCFPCPNFRYLNNTGSCCHMYNTTIVPYFPHFLMTVFTKLTGISNAGVAWTTWITFWPPWSCLPTNWNLFLKKFS